MNQDTV